VRAWQCRPLSAVYPILYFDALFVKTRQDGPVMTKAVYLALGINFGRRERIARVVGGPDGGLQVLAVGFSTS